jgi:hypothetical protein
MMCFDIKTVLLYNIYIIYISNKSLSHFKMKQIIIKKFYEVIRIINKKRHYLRGFYKGGPLGDPSHEPNFK